MARREDSSGIPSVLQIKHQANSFLHLFHQPPADRADALAQKDLSRVITCETFHDGRPRKVRIGPAEKDIPGRFGEVQIRRDDGTDDGFDAASIERIGLKNQNGPSVTRFGVGGFREFRHQISPRTITNLPLPMISPASLKPQHPPPRQIWYRRGSAPRSPAKVPYGKEGFDGHREKPASGHSDGFRRFFRLLNSASGMEMAVFMRGV